jgi:acyl-coenzyme A synthetase/AMP-(fatty) acid ligase/thioesterase domain-containing protein
MRDTHGASMPPVPAPDFEVGIVRRFGDVVAARPDAIALADAGRELTYRQLATEAVACLDLLRTVARPVSPQPGAAAEPIAVLQRHGAGAIAAILGVIASGHPLLVLDPYAPAARLKRFMDQVGARSCVADVSTAATATQIAEHVIHPASGAAARGHHAENLWAAPPNPAAPALLAFTSGSTGVPKVVVCDHRQLLSDGWANGLGSGCYTSEDVIAHTLPLAFYAGLLAALGVLVAGAGMRLHDVRAAGSRALPGWLQSSGATVLHTSPAILRGLVQERPDPAQLAALRSLTVAGEAAYGADLEAARRLLPPGCVVFNRYGSSETGLIADFRIEGGDALEEGPIPAGHPVGRTTLALLRTPGDAEAGGLSGDAGAAGSADDTGTVTVTRRHLALGYWNDPVATAATFSQNPDGTRTCRTNDVARFDSDGALRLLGRRDHSVKIGGFLVEPGEVDAALFTLPQVREALVVGAPDGPNGKVRLVAYVVTAVEQFGAAALRAALREHLPAHMIPATVVFLAALPRTERGKLDRAALPAPPPVVTTGSRQEYSEWERVVADAWTRVLSLDDVGLDDDFFELGGDSLAVQTLISIMVEELGVPAASTSMLIQAPTVRQFARRVTRRPASADDVLVPVKPSGSRPALFVVAGGGGLGVAFVHLARHLGADQPLWALQSHALERRGIPDWSVPAAARRNIKAIRRISPQGPYHLAGHSFGGLVALEMAHQLRRDGHEVGLLAMLDSFPPDPALHPSQRTGSPLQRLRHALGLALTGLRVASGQEQYWRFYRMSEWLHRRYRCEPWTGRTLVLVADSPLRAQRSRWGPHLHDWQLVEVEGDHLSMIREPFAADTAAALCGALLDWRSAGGPQIPAPARPQPRVERAAAATSLTRRVAADLRVAALSRQSRNGFG